MLSTSCRDVTDSEPESKESDTFSKIRRILKIDNDGFIIFVSVQLYNYFRLTERSVVVFSLLLENNLNDVNYSLLVCCL